MKGCIKMCKTKFTIGLVVLEIACDICMDKSYFE